VTAVAENGVHHRTVSAVAVVAGVVLAALSEALAGTLPVLGRADLMGDLNTTPDEFAWFDTGYTILKLVGFVLTPWLMSRFSPLKIVIGASMIMAAACGLSIILVRYDLLVLLRLVQGAAGGVVLVAGQGLLFFRFSKARQPMLQALFATGAVVAPATLAPGLEGWLVDNQSWTPIFLLASAAATAASGLLLCSDDDLSASGSARPFDWAGFVLAFVALCGIGYTLSQGERWAWFEEPTIAWTSVTGVGAFLAFVANQLLKKKPRLLDIAVFRSADFAFAFVVSFVAGAALYGSAFLIPAFALSVLAFTPAAAGMLLLPSGALFVASLVLSALLIRFRGLPPIATAPFGILMIMAAMWMLSMSTAESGAPDMMAAILLRGLGLGFLFLSITLIAFTNLERSILPSGIAFFDVGRQLGGLAGVAGLQILINHGAAGSYAALSANVSVGVPAVETRISATTAMLAANGVDPAGVSRIAASLLARATGGQAVVIAFDTAFIVVALLFIVAAPGIIALKIALRRHSLHRSRAGQTSE
jgi:DHA2 family multidrug resistance protein